MIGFPNAAQATRIAERAIRNAQRRNVGPIVAGDLRRLLEKPNPSQKILNRRPQPAHGAVQ